jgi:hypothetical protein
MSIARKEERQCDGRGASMIDQRLPNAAEMLGKSTRQAVLHNLGARYSSRDLASGAGMAQSLCSEAGIRGIPVKTDTHARGRG